VAPKCLWLRALTYSNPAGRAPTELAGVTRVAGRLRANKEIQQTCDGDHGMSFTAQAW